MDNDLSFTDILKTLPEICKEQRRFFGWSQAKAADKLREKYGLQKDASKISLLESRKTLIPDFLSEYCEILGIQFSRPEYRRKSMEIKPNDVLHICEKIKEYVADIMMDVDYKLHEDYEIEIKYIDGYYIAAVIEELFVLGHKGDTFSIFRKNIFAFLAKDIRIKLCGHMDCYQGAVKYWINENTMWDIACYLDYETATTGEMAIYMCNVMKAYLISPPDEEFYFDELYPGYISVIEDTYVYREDRRKGCLTAILHYLGSCESIEGGGTWICSTIPVYLDEAESKKNKYPEYKYMVRNNREDEKQLEQNIEILSKAGATDFVHLNNTTDGWAPYAVCNHTYREFPDQYNNDFRKLEKVK